MYRNMLISVSCDWETVKNVVTGNSSSKPDRTGRDGKFAKQSKMLNNSAYTNVVGWVINIVVTENDFHILKKTNKIDVHIKHQSRERLDEI